MLFCMEQNATVNLENELWLLGGPALFGNPKSNLDVDRYIRDHRIKTSAFKSFTKHVSLPTGLKDKIVPRSSLSQKEKLTSAQTALLLRLVRLIVLTKSIFDGDLDTAVSFLSTEHPELEDRSPFECALTEIGGREVEGLLHRIEYGLPA